MTYVIREAERTGYHIMARMETRTAGGMGLAA